jgi:hypothetical protein
MKIILPTIVTILLLAFLPAAKASEPKTALHLTYTSESGSREVLTTPSALKITNQSGLTLVARAPKWDACVSNTRVKKMIQIPSARWTQIGLGVIELELEAPKPDQKIDKRSEMLGLPAVHYRTTATLSDDYYRARRAPRKCAIDFYGTTALPVSDVQRHLLTLWLGVPSTKELPLLWLRSFADGARRNHLQIVAWKREPYNGHAFDEPTNYTLAHDTREVYLATSSSTLKDMFESELQQHK